MYATPLLLAALLSAPFTTRLVVPVVNTNVAIVAVPVVFNPTATARARVTTIVVNAQMAGTLTIRVESEWGITIKPLLSYATVAAGSEATVTWDGAGVVDGQYAIRATLIDATGVSSEAIAAVTVDTTPPIVTLAPVVPATTARGPVVLRARASDISDLRTVVLTIDSQLGRRLGTVPMLLGDDRASAAIAWTLRLRKRLLLPGVYTLTTTATDGAGNVGVSPPRILRVQRAVHNQIIYSLRDLGPVVALTFDDCVRGSDWLRIIRAFKAAKAHTTFFCNGVHVRSNPDVARAAVAGGHTIGSHTWAHPWMTRLSAADQNSQIAGDQEIWWQVARVSPAPFFRPPYGDHNAVTRSEAGKRGFAYTVLWDVDPSDYLNPPAGVLVDRVTRHARAGSIVVMHANANTAAAVPALIRALRNRGLEPKSLDEMFRTGAYLTPANG